MAGLPPRNSMFVGRDGPLEELKNALKPESSEPASKLRDPKSCVLHGVGGIGKSQVALEYAYRFGQCYSHIFWLKGETETALTDSFVNILQSVGIEGKDIGTEKWVELVPEWLELGGEIQLLPSKASPPLTL